MPDVWVNKERELEVLVPKHFWPGRWRIDVRGETVASGWCTGRNVNPVVHAIESLCQRLVHDGLGHLASDLQSLLNKLEDTPCDAHDAH